MLASMGVNPQRVLDLYAGTGALGIEALSRGAACADFVERNAVACAVIRENLDRTGFSGRGRVHCVPAERAFGSLTPPYALVFLDPPYAGSGVEKIFEALAQSTLLGVQTTLVYEYGRRTAPPVSIGPLTLVKTRIHGDSGVSFYRRSDPEASVHGGHTDDKRDLCRPL